MQRPLQYKKAAHILSTSCQGGIAGAVAVAGGAYYFMSGGKKKANLLAEFRRRKPNYACRITYPCELSAMDQQRLTSGPRSLSSRCQNLTPNLT